MRGAERLELPLKSVEIAGAPLSQSCPAWIRIIHGDGSSFCSVPWKKISEHTQAHVWVKCLYQQSSSSLCLTGTHCYACLSPKYLTKYQKRILLITGSRFFCDVLTEQFPQSSHNRTVGRGIEGLL